MVTRKFIVGHGDALVESTDICVLAVVVLLLLLIVGVEHFGWLVLHPGELKIRAIAVCESVMENVNQILCGSANLHIPAGEKLRCFVIRTYGDKVESLE